MFIQYIPTTKNGKNQMIMLYSVPVVSSLGEGYYYICPEEN